MLSRPSISNSAKWHDRRDEGIHPAQYEGRYTQALRDIAMMLLFVAAAIIYHLALRKYLSGLDRPIYAELGFLSSLAIACLYDLRAQWFRIGLLESLVTSVFFACAVWIAGFLRIEYIEVLKGLDQSIADSSDVAEFIGRDLHGALSTRYIGYGGCFAVGLLISRLALRSSLRAYFTKLFILPSNRQVNCPHCGQLTTARNLLAEENQASENQGNKND